jgi:hypothetical protein
MDLQLVIAVIGALAGWQGFTEKRLQAMKTAFDEKLVEKDKLNQVVQQNLKDDIARLETKIDVMLMRLMDLNAKKS